MNIRSYILTGVAVLSFGVLCLYSAPQVNDPGKGVRKVVSGIKEGVRTIRQEVAAPPKTTDKNAAGKTAQQTAAQKTTGASGPKDETTPDTKLKYPVGTLIPENESDLTIKPVIDLRNPDNIKTTVEYNPETGHYLFITRLGENVIGTPIELTREEYLKFQEEQSSSEYWKAKNKIDFSKKADDFSLTDMKFDIGLGDKIFGEGGVRLKTTGSIETKFGLKKNVVDNPSLSEYAKKRTRFNFDQNIQMSVNGKVGDKIDVNMNYDTEATFNYDAKSIKLRYDGKEDEIIKSLEAGNVSMPLNSTLITGGSSLFGIKSELQFGKLSLATVISQQKAQTKSVNLSGGVQSTPFEVKADQYDENRHYFLTQFFRNHYDEWMSQMPYISSGMSITKIEVWVTNKNSMLDNARNIVAFADLGESSTIFNDHWASTNTNAYPSNAANSLYNELLSQYSAARTFSSANATLEPLAAYGVEMGEDYERLESARKLDQNEYTLNSNLGYISLKQTLNSDEILAVAFEYTYRGKTYQVGEFSTDGIQSPKTLFVKLVKGTDYSPSAPTWKLMMRNVYSIGAYNLESKDFKFNVSYKNDSIGTSLNYLTEGAVKNELLIRVLGLDRLNSKDQAYPDGTFDFKEGYTVQSSNGRIIFPVVEPFGSYLKGKIGNNALAEKYVYQELYDSTLTVAQQLTEKNKFTLNGTYKAASGSSLSLGAMNVAPGSVTVTAGGQKLTENVDYTVDYSSGTVTILNDALISSGTAINATCEDQSTFSMIRKTMLGMAADYKFSDKFKLGGTVMTLSETPLTTKVDMGSESVHNTIWGLNTSFKTESQLLTNLVDKLPFINATKPSTLTFTGEVAQLIAGSSKALGQTSYVDDFELAKKSINMKDVTQWYLASTPSGTQFAEASRTNDLSYGYNRSLLAWYSIDGIFTQQGTSQTPGHIRNDYGQLSNHFVRTIQEKEIFPNRQKIYNQTGVLSVMNLAYYPKERGPYNYDWQGMGADGYLKNPQNRWGGIMRKIESGYTNFESNNVEYIEFWMMDPFVYDSTGVSKGGDLYFNLGDISEDVLKDGKRSFENGLPANAKDTAQLISTVWGKVSGKTSTAYAFDNTAGVRDAQDLGLDGLSTDEETTWAPIREYLNKLNTVLSPAAQQRMQDDPFSPFNDPAGDNFHFYRGSDYDAQKASILERYKHFNGTEGNSQSQGKTGEKYSTAATTLPNVEDINLDFTLSENERYYQYKVSIRPEDMLVGKNFINDKRTSTVTLKNGKNATISWYQFKIPVDSYDKKIGSINGFNSIRFMRMYLTGFQDSTILRLATLDLVRGDWRNYTKNLYTSVPTTDATVDVSTVSLEENSSRTPINYKLPPGVTQESDPSQPGVFLENEQSLAFKISDLSPGDARAVYKNTTYDFRQYKRLQMFTHAEAFMNDPNPPKDYEMTVFIRLGSDYQSNYYEYEIPLKISPFYVNTPKSIWPESNFFNIPFDKLTKLKTTRNATGAAMGREYAIYDDDNEQNKIKIMGNPSLSDIRTIMVGVRNKGNASKSVEIWMNELRLSGFEEKGGWAAVGNAVLNVSDVATVNAGGKFISDGFGGLEQSVSERSITNYGQYNMSVNFNAGRFFPEKAKINIPLFYSISNETTTPKYDPLNEDLLLSDVLKATRSQSVKDSILDYSQKLKKYKSINLSGVKFGIKSKIPMPFDPDNFTFNYSSTESYEKDATTKYEVTRKYSGGVSYSYTSPLKAFEPFAKSKSMTSPWLKVIKDFNLNPLPNSLSFNSNLLRDYMERQTRDLTSSGVNMKLPLTVSKNFLWNTDMDINWNITKNIRFKFSTNNKAMVEETVSSPVNKKMFATEYQNWKDTVSRSLRNFGTPLTYAQTTSLSWQIPTNRIPGLDFLTSTNAQYDVDYNWNRSALTSKQAQVGNTISNNRNITLSTAANLTTLYNKSAFLKSVSQKFDNPKSKAPVQKTDAKSKEQTKDGQKVPEVKKSAKELREEKLANEARLKEAKKKMVKKFEVQLDIEKDSLVLVKHNLKNKRVYIVAVDSSGREISLKMRVKDENSISVKGTSKQRIKVTVFPKTPLDEESWYAGAALAARLMMSVRNVSVNYTKTDAMSVPGFLPESSLFKSSAAFGRAPGWDFALGMQPEDFLQRSMDKGWLLNSDSVVTPAVVATATDLKIKSSIELLPSLKIELNAARNAKSSSDIQYMFAGMPKTRTGGFSITTIAIKTAFESPRASNGYNSKAFNQFLKYREVVADKLNSKLIGRNYPSTGFLASSSLQGQPYDPNRGTYSLNSADVMIPSFLAAYTGKNIARASLNIFPTLASLVPNWSVSYDGLSNLDVVRKYFRSVTLSHAYSCTYNVNSFSSFSSWADAGDGLGFVKNVLTGNPTPSSQYDIGSVTLMEAFNPLLRVQGTMLNGWTLKTEMRKSRSMTLSITGGQIIEAVQDQFTLGTSYKISDFHPGGFLSSSKIKNDLNLSGNVTYKNQFSLMRKITDKYSQASSGNKTFVLEMLADYTISKSLNMTMFYNLESTIPMVSSYPVRSSDFGFSVRFSLNR